MLLLNDLKSNILELISFLSTEYSLFDFDMDFYVERYVVMVRFLLFGD